MHRGAVNDEEADPDAIQLDFEEVRQPSRPVQASGVAGVAFERAIRNQIGQKNNNS